MSNGKQEILNRIQHALASVPDEETPQDVNIPREYLQEGGLAEEKLVQLFSKRVGEYKATVQVLSEGAVKETIQRSCSERGAVQVVIPESFPEEWLPDTLKPLVDRAAEPLSHHQLDKSDGVLTTCALAIAQTGTIILNAGEGQGRRVLTLLPDYHLCIVRESQIVELVPEAFAYFEDQIKREGPPVTLISGPSATSDIELNRVEGVHGPRNLEVLIVTD